MYEFRRGFNVQQRREVIASTAKYTWSQQGFKVVYKLFFLCSARTLLKVSLADLLVK